MKMEKKIIDDDQMEAVGGWLAHTLFYHAIPSASTQWKHAIVHMRKLIK